jgi:superfamily II DNA/RNA helicase
MTTKTFDSLGLAPKTLAAIKKINYAAPMPVQAEVIPLILQGKDALVSARTGSGKTASFTIPLFDIICRDENARALVIAPTRELAQQIHKVFNELALNANIASALITGGKFMQDQLRKLKKKPRFIAGTPGRLNDHIGRKSLVLDGFKYVIWDEMDRMLDLGFIHQVENIISRLPPQKQTLMLSATFPKRVETLAVKYLNNPARVIIDDINSVPTSIEQKTINTEGSKKPLELDGLVKKTEGQILVFAKTQRAADLAAKQLCKNNHAARALHGGLRQRVRDKITAAFRSGDFRILVATDVAARGLDIPKIACVINYDLPQSPEEYIHRIGRTGRVNEQGVAISLISKSDRKNWKAIQEFIKGKEPAFTKQEVEKREIILKANRNAGPFPVKKENKIAFGQNSQNGNVKKKPDGGVQKEISPKRQYAQSKTFKNAKKFKKYGRAQAKHWGKIFAKKAKRSGSFKKSKYR